MRKNKYVGYCTQVKDGDSFVLAQNTKRWDIRLASVDAPEAGQPFYFYAKKILHSLLFLKTVTVFVINRDGYGRLVCNVNVGNIDVSEYLIKLGAAYHYKKYCNNKKYAEIEAIAMRMNVGIWSVPKLVFPWEFRKSLN